MDFISSKQLTKERYNVLLRDAKPIEYNKLKALLKAKCKSFIICFAWIIIIHMGTTPKKLLNTMFWLTL